MFEYGPRGFSRILAINVLASFKASAFGAVIEGAAAYAMDAGPLNIVITVAKR